MKAVLRLFMASFTGTNWTRWMALIGVALVLTGAARSIWLPQSTLTLAWGFFGAGALFVSTTLAPLMFGRLAFGHTVYTLPAGPVKILGSAVLLTTLVSLPVPVLAVLDMMKALPTAILASPYFGGGGAFVDFLRGGFFWQMYAVTFLSCTWLYVCLWFVMRSRSFAGYVQAGLILIGLTLVPPKYVSLTQETSIVIPAIWIVVSWVIICTYFLLAPRLSRLTGVRRPSVVSRFTRPGTGREVALLLGASRPVVLLVVVLVCAGLSTWSLAQPEVWLFYLTMISMLGGATASAAAARSRGLWLRTPWSRRELFGQAEKAYWHHQAYALAVMSVALVATGIARQWPVGLIAAGVGVIVLAACVSTYLGLMMTRRLGWIETVLGIGVVLLILAAALLSKEFSFRIGGLYLLLALGAAGLRAEAMRRWGKLDWSACRAPTRQPLT